MDQNNFDWTNLLDSRCTSTDVTWSIIDSSPPNANLAAVLAGFMVTAIVFLLERRKKEDDRATAHTIALFFAGVLILGLNSYLFGSIASMRPQVQTFELALHTPEGTISWENVPPLNTYVCGIVWSQGMAASGMLAVGGTLLIAGLGWTITRFAQESKLRSKFFLLLGNILTIFVIVATYSHLGFTSYLYIKMMRSPNIDTHITPHAPLIMVALSVAVPAGCIAIIARKTIRLAKSEVGRELRHGYPTVLLASVATAALAILSPIYARVVAEAKFSTPSQMWIAILLCMIFPGVIFFLVALSSPGPEATKDVDLGTGRPAARLPLAFTIPLIAALTLIRKYGPSGR